MRMEARWHSISHQCTNHSIMSQWTEVLNNSTTQIKWAWTQIKTRLTQDSLTQDKVVDLAHKTGKDQEVSETVRESPAEEHQDNVDAAKCESIIARLCNIKATTA